jgi:hypothetical protein
MKKHKPRLTNIVVHNSLGVGVFKRGKDETSEKPIKMFNSKEWSIAVKLDEDGNRYIVSKDGKQKVFLDDLENED